MIPSIVSPSESMEPSVVPSAMSSTSMTPAKQHSNY
jgi:hypothetical protein